MYITSKSTCYGLQPLHALCLLASHHALQCRIHLGLAGKDQSTTAPDFRMEHICVASQAALIDKQDAGGGCSAIVVYFAARICFEVLTDGSGYLRRITFIFQWKDGCGSNNGRRQDVLARYTATYGISREPRKCKARLQEEAKGFFSGAPYPSSHEAAISPQDPYVFTPAADAEVRSCMRRQMGSDPPVSNQYEGYSSHKPQAGIACLVGGTAANNFWTW